MPRFVKLATLEELPAGAAKEVEFEGRVYALYNIDGTISAIDGICPHQGGPLAEGVIEGTTVTCPWHGWQFDVRSGQDTLWAPRSSSLSTRSRSRIRTCWLPFLEPNARSRHPGSSPTRFGGSPPLVAADRPISDRPRIDLGDPDR